MWGRAAVCNLQLIANVHPYPLVHQQFMHFKLHNFDNTWAMMITQFLAVTVFTFSLLAMVKVKFIYHYCSLRYNQLKCKIKMKDGDSCIVLCPFAKQDGSEPCPLRPTPRPEPEVSRWVHDLQDGPFGYLWTTFWWLQIWINSWLLKFFSGQLIEGIVIDQKVKSYFLQDAVFKSFTAGELKGVAGRKWRYREGTLAEEEDRREEEKEAEEFPTQVRGVVVWKLNILGGNFKLKLFLQESAKEWSLGCVNPASWLPLAMGGVTQPRARYFV